MTIWIGAVFWFSFSVASPSPEPVHFDNKVQEEAQSAISSAEMGDANPLSPVTIGEGVHFFDRNRNFGMNLRFRMQNRADFFSEAAQSDRNLSYNWLVRRARLRLNGFLVSPRLRYLFQLSFSRLDQDLGNVDEGSIVRDAMIIYDVSDELQMGFGQAKLPGNRQRVVSSGDLQFVDRSRFNAIFNVDRDFGFQAQYRPNWLNDNFVLKGSLTSGQGRNQGLPETQTLSSVLRAEWLPFGAFTRGGDYFESDLAIEEDMKMSLGLFGAQFPDSSRFNGVAGGFFRDSNAQLIERNQSVLGGDVLIKYQGYSFAFDLGTKSIRHHQTDASVFQASGWNLQVGKMLNPKWELALRRTEIATEASGDLIQFDGVYRETTVALNHFVQSHRVKLQTELSLIDEDTVAIRLQFELGI